MVLSAADGFEAVTTGDETKFFFIIRFFQCKLHRFDCMCTVVVGNCTGADIFMKVFEMSFTKMINNFYFFQ